MIKKEAEAYFHSLSTENKLEFMVSLLKDLESEIRAERPTPLAQSDSSPPPSFDPAATNDSANFKANNKVDESKIDKNSQGKKIKNQDLNAAPNTGPKPRVLSPNFDDEKDDADDFDFSGFDADSLKGGASHTVHHLRLLDVAERYQGLLKKYGYVRGVPAPEEILKDDLLAEAAAKRETQEQEGPARSAWSDWVAKDQKALDHPKKYDWKDWVTPSLEEKPKEGEKKA